MKSIAAAIALAATTAWASTFESSGTWLMLGPSRTTEVVEFTLALQMQNLDKLDELALSVSDPKSAKYGQYASIQEVAELKRPKPEAYAAARAWVEQQGISCKDMASSLRCRGTTGAVAQVFGGRFYEFEASVTGDRINCMIDAIEFPESVIGHVLFIDGLLPQAIQRTASFEPALPEFDLKENETPKGADSNGTVGTLINAIPIVVPETIRDLNFVAGYGDLTTSVCVLDIQPSATYLQSELDYYVVRAAVNPITISRHRGWIYPGSFTKSSTMHQIVGGQAYPAAWPIPGTTQFAWSHPYYIYTWTQEVQTYSRPDLADIYTMAFGYDEDKQCVFEPFRYPCNPLGSMGFVTQTNIELEAVGATGITIVATSGDDGAPGTSNSGCGSPTLFPFYPGSSPWVTSIGSSQVRPDDAIVATTYAAPACLTVGSGCLEGGLQVTQAWNMPSQTTSGGGFSLYSSMPTYQLSHVNNYLATPSNLPTPSSLYNAGNRAYPDISFIGTRHLNNYGAYDVYTTGGLTSTMTAGGVLAVVNAERLAMAMPLLGFANPLLYMLADTAPTSFIDITIGANDCTAVTCGTSCKGYQAATGWDATTGLGSIHWVNFVTNMAHLHNASDAVADRRKVWAQNPAFKNKLAEAGLLDA